MKENKNDLYYAKSGSGMFYLHSYRRGIKKAMTRGQWEAILHVSDPEAVFVAVPEQQVLEDELLELGRRYQMGEDNEVLSWEITYKADQVMYLRELRENHGKD